MKKTISPLGIYRFDKDFEDFLEIEKPKYNYLKPVSALWNYKNNKIKKENIDKLREIIKELTYFE